METIVVDNGSQENIQELVSTNFPDVRLIPLPKNYGFAYGNNRGIEVARGDFVALINNDAVASSGWIQAMVDTALRYPLTGTIVSVVEDGNSPGYLDSIGMGITLDAMSRQRLRGTPLPVLSAPQEVLLPSGCACMFRMSALKEAGGFDESFFAYCEDTDLGLRLQRAGWKAMVAPGANVTHYCSATEGMYSLRKVFLVERNHFWVGIKNFPLPLLVAMPFFTMVRYLKQAYYLLRGTKELQAFVEQTGIIKLSGIYLRAYMSALAGLPVMLSHRLAGKKASRLGMLETITLILRHRMSIREALGVKHGG